MAEGPIDPSDGQVRAPGTAAVRPRDAATLVLYRRRGRGIEVLMGERHGKHRFMPNRYVFPGGRVDATDWRIRAASELTPDVAARLGRSATPARARALAIAAIRETFEECGLLLGAPDPTPDRPVPAGWAAMFDAGFAPALDALDYVARAVTPPYRPMRFDARFFVADARRVAGEISGSGELLDLRWVPIRDARDLPIPRITEMMLGHVADLLRAGRPRAEGRPVPLYHYRHGRHVQTRE